MANVINLWKGFEMIGKAWAARVLRIAMDATESQAKVAYDDFQIVWKPRNFQNNPRLQAKAREVLAEVQLAYAIFTSVDSGYCLPDGAFNDDLSLAHVMTRR